MKKPILHLAVTSAIVLACSPVLRADSFTLLIDESKTDLAVRTDPLKASGYWAVDDAYARQLAEAGILRGGAALTGHGETKTVKLTQGNVQEADQPLATATSDLELGGYFIIEVPDQATAVKWARKAPGLATGAIELKRHFPNPTMSSK